jgi:hypothetical protein
MDPQYADTLAGLDGLEGDDMQALGAPDYEELGARYARQAPIGRRIIPPRAMPVRQLVPGVTGVPQRGLRRTYLPVGTVTWVINSPLAQTITAKTARPFRPTRIFAVVRTSGTTAASALITLDDFKMGQDSQAVIDAKAPIEAFGPAVQDSEMDLTPIGPGVEAVFKLSSSIAILTTDRVDVGLVLFGYAIQS